MSAIVGALYITAVIYARRAVREAGLPIGWFASVVMSGGLAVTAFWWAGWEIDHSISIRSGSSGELWQTLRDAGLLLVVLGALTWSWTVFRSIDQLGRSWIAVGCLFSLSALSMIGIFLLGVMDMFADQRDVYGCDLCGAEGYVLLLLVLSVSTFFLAFVVQSYLLLFISKRNDLTDA